MKRTALIFSIIMAFGIVCHAADATWTDTSGDHNWGNTNNWNTLALPGTADKATFPATINAIADYVVNMNGDRSVREIAISGAGKPQIIGPANTLTLNGNINGGSAAIFSTKIVFTIAATLKSTDSYGNKITLAGGVESPYNLIFSGSANNGMVITSGVYSVPSTTINPNTTFRNCVITNGILTLANTWSDANGNRTGLTIYSTAFTTNTIIATDKNAGAITFNNQGDIDRSVATIIRKIEHRQGSLSITPTFYGGTNIITVQEFICDPGTLVKIKNSKLGTPAFNAGVNAGLIIPGATNVNGTYKPNFMYDYYLTKVNANGALESCNSSTDYTVLPVATYDPKKMYRQNAVADTTLTQNSEVWAWLVDKAGDIALSLGIYDMTVGSGNMVFNGSGIKRVTSTGGKLVIGGDDFIIYAAGTTGSLTFSAPLAWRKPAGSTVQYPSLIFSGTGLPEVIFSGTDEIGDYNALNAEAGQTITSIIFGGSSNRNFHGKLTGRNRIYNRGTGTLTFSGADERRSAEAHLEKGTTILANNSAPQIYSVTNGAVCIVADGIVPSKRVTIYNGGIFCMVGTTASVGYLPVYAGGRIEGGAPEEVGTFKATGDFQPYGNFTFGLKISETANSQISLSKFIIPPVTGGATITVRVEDLSNGARTIRASDVFTVATATSFTNTTYPMNFVTDNASPTRLNTSAALVSYNSSAKTITITGIRSLQGTMIVVR